MADKFVEWLKGDQKELEYHTVQYQQPKEYTRLLLKKIKAWSLDRPNTTVIDLGCGAGANTYFFGKEFPALHFHGVDINPHYIDIANQFKLPNTTFEANDFTALKDAQKQYDGILSIQTLSWMDDFHEPLLTMFHLKPSWILITSLFYEGPVEAKIVIRDMSRTMGDGEERKTYYNIYSLDEIKKVAKINGYKLERAEPFQFPFDLEEPSTKGMGTYTKKLADGSRIQVSGPLMMPWYTLLLTKNGNA